MSKTSHADSIDMRRVLAIILLDSPCSRSSMISFALIFLAMVRTPSVRSVTWRNDCTDGAGDTHLRIERYGLRETAIMVADTETAKRVLLKRRNTHEDFISSSHLRILHRRLGGVNFSVESEK